jgi:transcriptional regulator with XRE-family HTH domain
MASGYRIEKIIDDLCFENRLHNEADLANRIGISRQLLSNWKKRNTSKAIKQLKMNFPKFDFDKYKIGNQNNTPETLPELENKDSQQTTSSVPFTQKELELNEKLIKMQAQKEIYEDLFLRQNRDHECKIVEYFEKLDQNISEMKHIIVSNVTRNTPQHTKSHITGDYKVGAEHTKKEEKAHRPYQ